MPIVKTHAISPLVLSKKDLLLKQVGSPTKPSSLEGGPQQRQNREQRGIL